MSEAPQVIAQKPVSWKDYKSDADVIWCPGCGDFGVLNAIYHTLRELELPPSRVALISGIGCSSRLPGYVATYGFNAIHGRPLPIASGVKLANRDLTVLAVGGDGDGLAIGAGHFPHAARRNVDITYIMMDNGIYGLTKGQTSPTTPVDLKTKSSQYGNVESPMNPAVLAISYNASFVGRGFAGNPKFLRQLFMQGIQNPGFSFIQVLSPCVTFRGGELFDYYRKHTAVLEDPFTWETRSRAYEAAEKEDPLMLGVLYRNPRPTFEEQMDGIRQQAQLSGIPKMEEIIDSFCP